VVPEDHVAGVRLVEERDARDRVPDERAALDRVVDAALEERDLAVDGARGRL
jgi:hypothetical protein